MKNKESASVLIALALNISLKLLWIFIIVLVLGSPPSFKLVYVLHAILKEFDVEHLDLLSLVDL